MSEMPILRTVSGMAEKYPDFTERWLRHIIHHATEREASINGERQVIEANGFGPCVIRVGRKVFLDERKLFEIIREQNMNPQAAGQHAAQAS